MLLGADGKIDHVNSLLINPHLTSPQGFSPEARSSEPVPVPAGSVWGRETVERLRPAAWVVVTAPGSSTQVAPDSWGAPARSTTPSAADATDPTDSLVEPGRAIRDEGLWALTVHTLALAGVPTSTADLPTAVRALLDPDLLRIGDVLDTAIASDRGLREQLSLDLRRAAWRSGPGRWFHPTPPVVVVQLPEDPTDQLLADLSAQEGVVARTASPEAPDAGEAQYVATMQSSLRYSPHHLADLVHGLLHSRSTLAHSPDRFRPQGDGSWLEQESVSDRGASGGLSGGSLWRHTHGLNVPQGPGYAVHGSNAVPAAPALEDRRGVLRWHPTRPSQLSWLDDDAGVGSSPAPSYPARKLAGVPRDDLTTATDSES